MARSELLGGDAERSPRSRQDLGGRESDWAIIINDRPDQPVTVRSKAGFNSVFTPEFFRVIRGRSTLRFRGWKRSEDINTGLES